MSNNNVICTICAERYRNSDNIHAGSCGHAFHEECLFRWRDQSRTCPICRSEDAAYFQLYLSFEQDGAAGGGGGSERNLSQDNSSSNSPTNSASSSSSTRNSNSSSSSNSSGHNSSINSSSSSTGIMREFENMLYEKDLYQQEIEYLNECIGALTLRNSKLKCRLAESESDSDSD
ncbi:hypothetical protein KR059_000021 [Drosophila kikkawai]|nr:hypothetical protein KR059_000021 [Drosophila kikkawai]